MIGGQRNVRFWPKADISLRRTCPLLGVKRTCHFALQMSANDPKRTDRDRNHRWSYRLMISNGIPPVGRKVTLATGFGLCPPTG